MSKYRKKPVVIDAFELGQPWPDWFTDRVTDNTVITHLESQPFGIVGYAEIKTLEGVMRAEVGDFIIKGVKGELYPCKADIFAATYEAVE